MANCASHPSAVLVSGVAMIPALLTRTCRGPSHASTKAWMEPRSARSTRPTRTFGLPVSSLISAATAWPAATSRTARVTSAPVRARARAVSTPMPDAAPVTTARRPVRSTPRTTSSAVVANPNGVVTRGMRGR